MSCYNEPEIVVCDPCTCPLFNQQCVIASNLQALPDDICLIKRYFYDKKIFL